MGTRWIPMTRMEPLRWLLSDGSIMSEPALEMTATGRKVRMAGSEASVYASQVDTLLNGAAKTAAAERGLEVWLPLPEGRADLLATSLARYAGIDLDAEARLHFLHQPGAKNVNTKAYWRFKDPNSPYEAIVTTILYTDYSGSHSISTAVGMPAKEWSTGDLTFVPAGSPSFSGLTATLAYYDQNAPFAWSEFIRDNPQPLPLEPGTRLSLGSPRAAVQALFEAVTTMEDVSTIRVPHLGDPANPSWLTLEMYNSNVSGQFTSDLAEYLDGSPTIDRAVEVYQELLGLLKSVGITVEGKSNNDFMAALLAGDKAQLNVNVSPLSDLADNGVLSEDDNHTLDVHLPTGTFVINCSHGEAERRSAAADHWEEAKVKASLTGELPELLAFARRDVESTHGSRSRKIMKARK